jgi:hypothetical protein
MVTPAILFSFKRFGDSVMYPCQSWIDTDCIQRFLAIFAIFSKLSIVEVIASHRKDAT